MRHMQGLSRDQITLFPESLDENITDDNPVHFLDAFVNAMDLQNLGFKPLVQPLPPFADIWIAGIFALGLNPFS